MDQAGEAPTHAGAQPPGPPGPPQQPVDTGARTPLADTPRTLPATYRSSATRGMVAMVLVGLAVAGYGVRAVVELSQLGMLDAAAAGTLTQAEGLASDARVATVGALASGAYIVSAIAVLVWLWRAVGNVPILTARSLRWSGNEAVGWWFVPIANWVMPYRIVRDAFSALGAGAPATIVLGWWVCHVTANVIAWLVIAGGRTAMDSLESIRSLVLITAAMVGLEIVAGILLLLVIRRFEGFARGWERGSLVPEDAAPAWPQPGAPAYAAGPLNPGAPAAWPDAATAPDAPFDDPRTIESIVVSADGPPAPPPPASGPAASGPSAPPPPPASA